MPQLIVLALIGAGALAGYRWVSKQLQDAAAADEHASGTRDDTHSPKDLGRLEWDAQAGAYRPAG